MFGAGHAIGITRGMFTFKVFGATFGLCGNNFLHNRVGYCVDKGAILLIVRPLGGVTMGGQYCAR